MYSEVRQLYIDVGKASIFVIEFGIILNFESTIKSLLKDKCKHSRRGFVDFRILYTYPHVFL